MTAEFFRVGKHALQLSQKYGKQEVFWSSKNKVESPRSVEMGQATLCWQRGGGSEELNRDWGSPTADTARSPGGMISTERSSEDFGEDGNYQKCRNPGGLGPKKSKGTRNPRAENRFKKASGSQGF